MINQHIKKILNYYIILNKKYFIVYNWHLLMLINMIKVKFIIIKSILIFNLQKIII